MTKHSAPVIFDRALLARYRQRAAEQVRYPDFLLTRVGEDFAERLSLIMRSFPLALNIGRATGALSRMLGDADGTAFVVDTDVVRDCLGNCPTGGVIADEEALPFRDEAFDLVVSGLTLQYVNDLPGTLAQVRRILKPDGLFLGTIVGGKTLSELRQAALQAELDLCGGASPRVAPFVDVRDLGQLLQRAGFALPVVDADVITVTYATPLDLMREIKAMGAGNVLVDRRRVPMTRGLLQRIGELYCEHFSEPDGRVRATFEILTMTGWAPHESQPQPLRPGSAEMRLADALGNVGVSPRGRATRE